VSVSDNQFDHTPVLVEEVCELMTWQTAHAIADLTVGGAGHLSELLKRNSRPDRIVIYDQDPAALRVASDRLQPWQPIEARHSNFENFEQEEGQFDRILVDLGVSSHQLDTPQRGFSFQKEGPLDMRMNPQGEVTAADLLFDLSEAELADLFYHDGEERRARVYARRWQEAKSQYSRSLTTLDFVRALDHRPDSKDPQGRHPLTRVFQALRIRVNREFHVLDRLLDFVPQKLSPQGRLGIISFHSLEDRRVKWGLRGKLKPINKKVVIASADEQKRNPRSRTAKLRVYERQSD
jgi:16S rRNA (cytosine1402-N4)-methyltransferase